MLRGPRGSTSHALDDTGTAGPMLCSWEDCDPPVGETLRGTSWHVKTPLAFWLHILVWLEPIHLPVVRNICDFPQVMSGLCHFTIQCSMAMTLLSTVIRLSQFEFLVPPLTTVSFPQAFSTFQLSASFHLQDLDLICTSSMPKQIIEHTPPPAAKVNLMCQMPSPLKGNPWWLRAGALCMPRSGGVSPAPVSGMHINQHQFY